MWSRFVNWLRGLLGPPQEQGPSALELMQELRESRATRERPRGTAARRLPRPAPDADTPTRGEVPWYERQRRQAAARDGLRDDYDEFRSP